MTDQRLGGIDRMPPAETGAGAVGSVTWTVLMGWPAKTAGEDVGELDVDSINVGTTGR